VLLPFLVRNAVVQLDQAILEAFGGLQLQGDVTVATTYEWNAVSDKDRNYTDDELVDRILVKKGGDELAASHQPDVLSGLLAKPAYERADWTIHEFHAWRHIDWRSLAGKDDVTIIRAELCSHAQARFISFPAQQLRIDRLHEGLHAIEAFGSRARRQPFNITVRTRDVTIRAGCDVDDDFSAFCHEAKYIIAR